MRKAVLLLVVLIVSLLAGCALNITSAQTTTITHVGSNARGINTGNTITVATSALPTEGNVLIAVIGLRGSSGVISTVVQTGVQWKQLQTSPSIGTGSSKIQVAIWAGIVGSGAASTITITCTGSMNAAVADVNEYSGLNTEFILNTSPTPCYDGVASSSGSSSSLNTGITATTKYVNELWIAGTVAKSEQSMPQNGFTLEDGSLYSSGAISVGYLDNIVASTGTAQTGTTSISSGDWSAILVTLPAASSMTLTPDHIVFGTDTVIECSGKNVAVNTAISAKWDGADITFTGDHSSDHGGSFLVNIALPPASAAGAHSVIVTDGATSAHATFTVNNPVSVLPESDIGISGILIAVTLAIVVWTTLTRKSKQNS